MGTYLNPGKENYQMAVNSEIFVDMTEMMAYLNTVINTQQRYVSVSRPRRFGKTMAADMICAYYDRTADSGALFAKRKLAQCDRITTGTNEICWDTYLGKFNVVRLVMTDFIKTGKAVTEGLKTLSIRILDELNETYPDVKYDPSDLFYSMDRFYRSTGTPFILVIEHRMDGDIRTVQVIEGSTTPPFRSLTAGRDTRISYICHLPDIWTNPCCWWS